MSSESPVILLVERDTVTRSPLAKYLRECGFVVHEAVNGKEAQLALKAPASQIQIVLADMKTEGAGFVLRQWIAAEKINVDVILAGSVEKAVEQAGKLCNEGPAIAKPYEHYLVLDHIRKALAQRDRALRQGDEGK